MGNETKRRVLLVSRGPSTKKHVATKSTKTTQIKSAAGKTTPPPLIPHRGKGGWGLPPLEGKKQEEREALETLKRNLRELTKPSQKEISDFLLLELRSTGKPVPSQDRDVEMWSTSVLDALRASLKSAPTSVARKSPLWTSFVDSYEILDRFLVDSGVVGMQSVQRKGLYNLLAKLLVAHSKSLAGFVDSPLSAKFVCGQSHMLPGLFENAWPGYLESGLAMRVVESLAALSKNS